MLAGPPAAKPERSPGRFERFERLSSEDFYQVTYAKTRSEGDALKSDDDLLKAIGEKRNAFLAKMDDDFNTGGAVSELFETSRLINRFIEDASLEDSKKRSDTSMATLKTAMSILRELGAILGLFIKRPKAAGGDGDGDVVEGLMQLLIKLRADARSNKDFATSDAIRDGLGAVGITLQDLKEGTTWEQS